MIIKDLKVSCVILNYDVIKLQVSFSWCEKYPVRVVYTPNPATDVVISSLGRFKWSFERLPEIHGWPS